MVEEIQGWAYAPGAGKGPVSWRTCREPWIPAAAFVRSRVPGAELLVAPGKSATLNGVVCAFQSRGAAVGTRYLCCATFSRELTARAVGHLTWDLALVATVRHDRTDQSDYDGQRTYVSPVY